MAYFWAKTTDDGAPGISALSHMINAGSVARCMAEYHPSFLEKFKIDPQTIGALAALHDFVKCFGEFQQ